MAKGNAGGSENRNDEGGNAGGVESETEGEEEMRSELVFYQSIPAGATMTLMASPRRLFKPLSFEVIRGKGLLINGVKCKNVNVLLGGDCLADEFMGSEFVPLDFPSLSPVDRFELCVSNPTAVECEFVAVIRGED